MCDVAPRTPPHMLNVRHALKSCEGVLQLKYLQVKHALKTLAESGLNETVLIQVPPPLLHSKNSTLKVQVLELLMC